MAADQNVAYRRMLARLSDMLRQQELESMKFMCQEMIPRGRLDDIDTAIHLWIALEERDKLYADDIGFLETLLGSCCGGRQDVLMVLDEYKGSMSPGNMEDLGKAIDFLASNVGRDWRPLARKLGLSEGQIEGVTEKWDRNLQEQVRQSLLLWQKNSSKSSPATKQNLIEALKACKKNMLAYQLENNS